MGTYVCTQEEIMTKIENLLDNLEGEVFETDFRTAVNRVANKYPYFT